MRVVWVATIAVCVMLLANAESAGEEEEDGFVEVEGEQQADVKQVEEIEIANKEPFVATSEWQKVKTGQAIPPGLHVRLNMQTGEREAKLLDPQDASTDSRDNSALSMTPDSGQEKSVEKKSARMAAMEEALKEAMKQQQQEQPTTTHGLSREQLKEALKKFKAEKDDVQDPKIREMKNKFRSIDELKKELADLELNVKTDRELLTQLLQKYRDPNLQPDSRINLLTDLEYYVHQIDNAQDFTDMGGLELVIRDLNNTSQKVRSEAAFVIGSATQSNPKVQVGAVEAGALQQLIRMLPREEDLGLRGRVIYALSSIIRHFPHAQEKFISQGGMDALRHLFNEAGVGKLKVKAVTLLTDMLHEMRDGLESEDAERKQQYERIPLLDAILDQGWCDLIPTLLHLPDHDVREKVIASLHALITPCSPRLHRALPTLTALRDEYARLAATEATEDEDGGDGGDVYFGLILEKLNVILEAVLEKEEL